jgi:hypothetical protein
MGLPMNISKFISAQARLLTGLVPALLLLTPTAPAQTKLDTTQFLVVGEGIAAGMADFGLRDVYQKQSFPAQIAGQIKTAFPMPLIQPPGISGGAPGFNTLPAGFPVTLQGSVRDDFPPNLFVFNLAMPSATVSDALNLRPAFPLIQAKSLKQTAANLILGYPTLIIGQTLPLWSQVEYAVAMNPTLVVVELGYYDVLNAAATNDPTQLPTTSAFTSNYSAVLSKLAATGAQVVVMTIPDPFDTGYFTPLASAPALLGGAPVSLLSAAFGIGANDYITPNGLSAASTAVLTNNINPFVPLSTQPNLIVNAATHTAVESSLSAYNAAIASAAKQAGSNVIVYDLQGLFHQIRQNGLTIGSTTLTADYLGGFYTLDGYYPGSTGQTLIANGVLTLLNSTYKTNFPLVDITKVVSSDPALRLRPSFIKRPLLQPTHRPGPAPAAHSDARSSEGTKEIGQ